MEAQLRQNLTCANGTTEIAWNFETGAQDWSEWNEIANSKFENGVWTFDATGNDPILGSPLVNVRGARLGALQVKMRARADGKAHTGQVYWRTRAMDDFSPALVSDFDVIADDAMHTYEISLPVQRGDGIAQLRLDPIDAPAQIALDAVALKCK